ncbi:hypothetical protein DICVIV_04764 [Dictyocaulus viviparus]|uniref:Uncharacterized protein n=1 Tax=Dictyocaulus viviparus TaxID=29172 RepID=A0A0D8XZD4_DICVI|nr:hypothetical protein DICVIV_04764 [Dictyocaulus viviparus]
MSAGIGHHSLIGGTPHQVPGPRTQGPATGGQQLSATANQFVDKIDPFSKRGTSRRRRVVNSSRYHAENEPELVQLPLIKDTAANEQPTLVLQKLVQCQKIFDFYDPVAQLKSKEIKRAALNELIDHITTTKGAIVESIYPEFQTSYESQISTSRFHKFSSSPKSRSIGLYRNKPGDLRSLTSH